MSTDSTGSKTPIETPRAQTVDMRLEIVVILFRTSIAPSAFTAAWVGGSTPTSPPATTSA
jgi:hypothetical protein